MLIETDTYIISLTTDTIKFKQNEAELNKWVELNTNNNFHSFRYYTNN